MKLVVMDYITVLHHRHTKVKIYERVHKDVEGENVPSIFNQTNFESVLTCKIYGHVFQCDASVFKTYVKHKYHKQIDFDVDGINEELVDLLKYEIKKKIFWRL